MPEPLPRREATYYDILGVPRNAKLTDITRAYNRHRSEIKRDDRPPDLKRETLFREAYETLSDADRRDAYDASLLAPERRHRSRMRAIVIGAVGVTAAGIALWWLSPPPHTGPPPRLPSEVLAAISPSVGRLSAIDVSGRTTRAGLAFAIGDRMFVGSCQGLDPGAQVVVNIPTRAVPVRVASADGPHGLCGLVSEGLGGRPLDTITRDIKGDELVYGARMNEAGKLVVTQGKVKRVIFEGSTRVIESVVPEERGAPLLDAQGLVIAVAIGNGKHVPVPAPWLQAAREPFKEDKPVAPAVAETQPASPRTTASPRGVPKTIDDIPPERREKLEKAFVPPTPDKKDDWMK